MTWLFRIILGIVFLIFGAMKLVNIPLFVLAVKEYGILSPPVGKFYALSLPWVELTIGLCFLVGFGTRWAALMAILILTSFAVATIVNLYIFHITINSCGCLGRVDWPLSWSHLVIQAVLLGMAGYLLFRRSDGLSLDAIVSG